MSGKLGPNMLYVVLPETGVVSIRDQNDKSLSNSTALWDGSGLIDRNHGTGMGDESDDQSFTSVSDDDSVLRNISDMLGNPNSDLIRRRRLIGRDASMPDLREHGQEAYYESDDQSSSSVSDDDSVLRNISDMLGNPNSDLIRRSRLIDRDAIMRDFWEHRQEEYYESEDQSSSSVSDDDSVLRHLSDMFGNPNSDLIRRRFNLEITSIGTARGQQGESDTDDESINSAVTAGLAEREMEPGDNVWICRCPDFGLQKDFPAKVLNGNFGGSKILVKFTNWGTQGLVDRQYVVLMNDVAGSPRRTTSPHRRVRTSSTVSQSPSKKRSRDS